MIIFFDEYAINPDCVLMLRKIKPTKCNRLSGETVRCEWVLSFRAESNGDPAHIKGVFLTEEEALRIRDSRV